MNFHHLNHRTSLFYKLCGTALSPTESGSHLAIDGRAEEALTLVEAKWIFFRLGFTRRCRSEEGKVL